ncbi:MAG TPA: hypothetical protein VK689_09320, partial [Armatimonadota bacterium]|nr:hypothetical protein [Armatimonadota bacterium]
MLGHTTKKWRPRLAAPPTLPPAGRLRLRLNALGVAGLARVLGAADGHAVGTMTLRELALTLRSREWNQYLFMWALFCAGVLAIPILYRSDIGNWQQPSGAAWSVICGYTLQAAITFCMIQWSIRRLRKDLYSNRLDELLLTRCTPADIAMGEALSAAIASLWLVAASFP